MIRSTLLPLLRRVAASRHPDYTIRRRGGTVVCYRWWVIPRNRFFNVYLHEWVGSDDDGALHDHPWPNLSWVLEGGYSDLTPAKGGSPVTGPWRRTEMRVGSIRFRWPREPHRVELPEGEARTWTLFFTGPKVRSWGFYCPKGWVPWWEYADRRDSGYVGAGCDGDSAPYPRPF